MSNIDKQALREAAEKAISEEGETWWNEEQLANDYGLALHRADAKFIAAANPYVMLSLLDELKAKDRLNAELMEKQRLIDICQGQGLEHRIAAEKRAEAAEKRIAELDGELEVSQHDLSDTEDAMHIWAERAEKAESKFSVPVAYAPKGHIGRYLNGENSGCWVYGNPIGEDYDTLYMAAPNNSQHISRNTICEIAHGKCSRIPGATFYNAAGFALDEVYRAAAGKGATS